MPKFELTQNESLLKRGNLKYISGWLSVTPRDIYLTSLRIIIFKQHFLVATGGIGVLLARLFKSQRIEIEIPLKDIVSISSEKFGLRGKKTVIKTIHNKEVSFFPVGDIWINAIKGAIKNHQPNIKIKTIGESIEFSE